MARTILTSLRVQARLYSTVQESTGTEKDPDVTGRPRSASLGRRARVYAMALLAYGIGMGYLATLVLDPHWGFVLIVSTFLLGIATTLYFLELYETRLTQAVAQEERLEGAVRTTRLMAERLRQPITVVLGHGELLRARGTRPIDPSVEEIVATAAEMEVYLCQLETAQGFAKQVLDADDPLGSLGAPAEPGSAGAELARPVP
jgi:signal transduction histidine kinase